MKKRIISLLAIIAMLCSMVIVVLPAMAADAETIAMYTAMANDAASGADALLAAISANADAGALAEAAKSITFKADAKPRYAWKAAYVAAGYKGSDYAITLADDWKAMMADADASTTLNSKGVTNYFKGMTFHLTNDVDFKDAGTIAPMGFGKMFAGTIDGHGYGFSNITLAHTFTTKAVQYVGLVCGFEGVMKDFGINSGTFTITSSGTAATYQYAAMALIGSYGISNSKQFETTPVITRVWNNANMISVGSAAVGGLVSQLAQDSASTVNGFYFGGTISAPNSINKLNSPFFSGNSRGVNVYNVICEGAGDQIVCYGDQGTYTGAKLKNVYGIDVSNLVVNYSGVAYGDQTLNAGLKYAKSAIDAAYAVNTTQPVETGAESVYFKMDAAGKLRPTADASVRVVKAKITGGVNKTIYMNSNTAYTLDQFAAMIDLDKALITDVKIGGASAGNNIKVADDLETIQVEVVNSERLKLLIEEYKDIDLKHLVPVDAGKVSLQAFREAAAAAGDNETKIQEVLDMVPNLQIKVTEVVADLPVFSDYAIYKDYNENQNWLIKTADDWKAMMTVADASTTTNSKGTPNYFKGYTFHLVQDVDFAEAGKISMMGVGKMFSGNINGHGFGFKNFTFEYDGGKTPANHKVGMMQMFEGTMQDFGINSGSFTAITTGGSLEMGMIGGFASGNGSGQETSAKILRVWNHASSMTASGHASNNISALVGYHAQDVNAVVNGFYTTVQLPINDVTNGGMSGVTASNSRGLKVYNVISDTEAEYLLVYGNEATAQIAVVQNVYTTGTENFFVNYSKVPYANSVNSGAAKAENAFEAAMKINAAQDPADSIEDIYFVVKDGKLCFGAKENRVRKVTLTGFNTGVYYFSANTAIDLVEEFGFIPSGQIATVTGSASAIDGTILNLGDEDITLDIILDCDHAEGFTYTATENAHIKACKLGCGYSYELPCTAESYTNNAPTFEQLLAGEKATHSGTCEFCGEAFTQDCTVTYVVSEEAGVDNCWDYSECDCGRANVAHKDTADMLGGDANGDGKIDLLDALRMLRHLVDQSVQLNEKNANLDSDAAVTVAEVRKVVRFWLGDPLVIDEVKAHQNYMNASNLFNFTTADEVRLNQDGSEVASDDYVASAAIAVKKSNKVTFGPVRPTQAVYGYAYDAQMNPIEPIAFDNTEVVLTFANKAVLACYEVPEGVAYIKLSAETEYADKYVARFNSNMTLIEYETRTDAKTAGFKNILKGKNVLTVGDSICAAGADYADANGLRGWARHIAKEYDAIVTNSGVSGAAFSDCRYNRSGVPTSQIYHQIGQHVGTKSFDYILLHGGVNDAWDDIDVGEVSDSFNPDDFDITTYAGGMEMAIYTAVKNYGDTAAIGYLINFESPLHSLANDTGKYFEVGRQICDKWGIKYLDLYNDVEFDTENLTVVKNGVTDKIHPTAEGYEVLAPYINAFMTEMRPVPYDIYSQIN